MDSRMRSQLWLPPRLAYCRFQRASRFWELFANIHNGGREVDLLVPSRNPFTGRCVQVDFIEGTDGMEAPVSSGSEATIPSLEKYLLGPLGGVTQQICRMGHFRIQGLER